MGIVPVTVLFFLVTTVCDATRKERVAAGRRVESPLTYPWIVFVKSVYEYLNIYGEIDATCSKGCTGSFIDVYGSVITAAHCVDRHIVCKDKRRVNRSCELSYVQVKWGVISATSNKGKTERVPDDEDRIIRFEELVKSQRVRVVDVALIYLITFQASAMTCKQQSMPRPINIDPTLYSPDWSEVGIFAGFGVQPSGYEAENNKYCYTNYAGPLSEIHMRYDAQFKQIGFCKSRHCYNGYAEIYERPSDTDRRHPEVGGTCQGDSGGPYMVREHKSPGRMILRGTLIGGPNYNKNHSCSGFFDPNYFVKVSSKEVRNWLVKELNDTYINKQLHASRVPQACETL